MKDPKGNELKVVLLQVMEKDEQGPVLLRVRRDHERVDLEDERHRRFLMVWAPVNQVLGEMRLSDLHSEFDALKVQVASQDLQRVDLARAIADCERDLAALQAENKTKTEALRELQKERDPARLERAVEERTQDLDLQLAAQRSTSATEIAALKSRVAELEASKRKLREALDRAKK